MARGHQTSAQWMAAVLLPILVAFGVVAAVVGGRVLAPSETEPSASPTPTGPALFVDPGSEAATAASALASPSVTDQAEADRMNKLAAVPTAIWLTPERYPVESVGKYVTSKLSAATSAGQLVVFAVYGVPDRDCGQESAGGLDTSAEYHAWVQEIATAIGKTVAWVILEPDSLALSVQCADPTSRMTDISDAIDVLTQSAAVIYLDGGHSQWLPASQMASLLSDAGVARVRGFATNVSNFNTTGDEETYAQALSSALGNVHYVIDVSRNGNGSNGEWCNPSGRALGQLPDTTPSGTRDGLLWIKPPGESDGQCNGGPKAGTWWQASADELMSNAGW